MSPNYTVVEGLVNLLRAVENGPDESTGIKQLVTFGQNLLGYSIPQELVTYEVSLQINLFGDYPTKADVVPSTVFACIFFVLMIIHSVYFGINCSRGHYFYLTVGWIICCAFRLINFALRAGWAPTPYNITMGLTGAVFAIVPTLLFTSLNLILAQRLFTWRHPVGGSRKLFWNFMITVYVLVVVVLAVTVLASFVPYLYYLSTSAFLKWQVVVKITAIMVILYSLCAMILIGLSYWTPTQKDENLYTYQPWWIESFGVFYFVKPGAAQQAEETFMKRNHNHRHAVRVIPATLHEHNMVEGLSNQRGDLKHNWSIVILAFSTIVMFIGALFRAITVINGKEKRYQLFFSTMVPMYVIWGGLEAVLNVVYIVGRVDLRFYRPDVLPAKVRAIITANQTNYVSDEEEDDTQDESKDLEEIRYPEKSFVKESFDHESEWRVINVDTRSEASSPDYGFRTYSLNKKKKENTDDFHF